MILEVMDACMYTDRNSSHLFTVPVGDLISRRPRERDREREDERGPRVEWIACSSLRMMEYVLSARPEK
jgi:hypothetical protein